MSCWIGACRWGGEPPETDASKLIEGLFVSTGDFRYKISQGLGHSDVREILRLQSTLQLPRYRLYVLRASYLLLGLGQGSKTWPAILHPTQPWDFWHGVGISFFGALTLLCLLGVRYPVRMMPLLMFEFTWKLIWVLAAWLRPYLGHTLDLNTADSFSGIFAGVVVVPLVPPWVYLWKTYVTTPGDRWR